ncbi:MAG: Calx-beta domain-containing protein [Fibrobacterota bacterium]
MNFKNVLCFVLLAGALLLGLGCYNPTNPFLDTDRAKASVYTKSFTDRDTVQIFSRETLSVVVYLKEHIRRVDVHIPKNRLSTSADTTISLDAFTGDPVKIVFSFYDTGWQKIEVRSLQNSGKVTVEEYSLYARSPLYQKTVIGNIGDTAQLKTQRVDDRQVLYVWDFHDGNIVKEDTNQVRYIIKSHFTSTIGELYVTDLKYKSPSVPFSIGARSATALDLTCLNDSILKDSVYTNLANFTFKVALGGTESLKSASINGIPFDNVKVQSESVHLFKTFNSLDTLTKPMKTVVVAVDDRGTSVEKTFYIHYDNTVTTEVPKIIVSAPVTTNDSSYVMQSQQVLLGQVSGTITYEQLYIQSFVNGTFIGSQKIIPGNTDWTLPVQLQDGWNLIQLQLSKDSSQVISIISAKALYINFNPDKIDTVSPVINAIRLNGIQISTTQSTMSREKNPTLSALVSDNNRVTSVTINGGKATADASGVLFSKQVTLSHDRSGQQCIICAEDSAGNRECDTVTIRYNRIPEILSASIPATMTVDSEYVISMQAADPDSDALTSTLTLKGTRIDSVASFVNGSVRWKPTIQDTGALRLVLHVSDPFFESDETVQTVQVLKKFEVPRVKFKTTDADFPSSIDVGTALSIVLKTDTLTGTPPFKYTLFLKNPSTKLYEGTNPAITWMPTRADAGVQTLQAIVYDNSGFSDTITALVNIIARAAATVGMKPDTLRITEGEKSASAMIRLSKPLADSVKISYKVNFITATTSDITLNTTGSVTFKPGDTLATIPLDIVDDIASESDEVVSIQLATLPALSAHDSLAVDYQKDQIFVIIKDNDSSNDQKIEVMLQPQQTVTVPEMAGVAINAPVIILKGALSFDLTVTVKPTVNTTATKGSDYTALGEDIIVKAGTTEVTLQFRPIDDKVREKTEYAEFEIVKISDTTKAFISNQRIVKVEITDND